MKTITNIIVVALVWMAIIDCQAATLDTGQLADAIIKNLTNDVPQGQWAYLGEKASNIASSCSEVTNSAELFKTLTNKFATELNLTNSSIVTDAEVIALEIFNPGMTIPFSSTQKSTSPDLDTNGFSAEFSKWISIQAGVIVLSAFSISPSASNPGKFELAPSSTDVRGMIQVIYKNRYAWRNYDFDPNLQAKTNKDRSIDQIICNPFNDPTWDFEFRGGYAYGGSGSQSGATTGAGDFFEEASIGFNLIKIALADDSGQIPLVSTINLEGFEGMYSDRNYSIIHPTFGCGFAYVAGFPLDTTKSNPNIELLARSGIAWVDSPYLGGMATNGNAIVDGNGNGDPKFLLKPAWASTAELRLPIDKNNQYGALVVGGSFYFLPGGEQRDQWSMYAGYSIAPSSLLNLIEAPIKLFFPNLQ